MEFVTSQQGIDRIKKFESCRLTAYQDAAGVWTMACKGRRTNCNIMV